MKETFGEFIRRVRGEKGFTLTELAALLKMDSANLSKVETGKREFDEKRLLLLSKAFAIDFSFLTREFLSDQVAKKLYRFNDYDQILNLAEGKIKYYIQSNTKQGKLITE
ncbi:helix-turn-helix domain-containing protein [Flagellimonas sp.]|uniref:helix-turn-helix domain-containing protein n=1 Tax=Flagellimonas sp. TaxID=2058762 RepID=UPI003AB26156